MPRLHTGRYRPVTKARSGQEKKEGTKERKKGRWEGRKENEKKKGAPLRSAPQSIGSARRGRTSPPGPPSRASQASPASHSIVSSISGIRAIPSVSALGRYPRRDRVPCVRHVPGHLWHPRASLASAVTSRASAYRRRSRPARPRWSARRRRPDGAALVDDIPSIPSRHRRHPRHRVSTCFYRRLRCPSVLETANLRTAVLGELLERVTADACPGFPASLAS